MKLSAGEYQNELQRTLADLDTALVEEIAEKVKGLTQRQGTLFVAGNGGSAATASHLVCDIQKTVLGHGTPNTAKARHRVIALNDNVPLLTAWGNDAHYDQVFAQPLLNLGSENDLLLVITGSGNSPNILEALAVAKEIGMQSYAFLGFDGGKAKGLADEHFLIAHDHYGVIEDMHMIIVHMLTDLLKHHE